MNFKIYTNDRKIVYLQNCNCSIADFKPDQKTIQCPICQIFFLKYDKEKCDKAYSKGDSIISDNLYDELFGIQATGEYLDQDSPWEKFKHIYPGCGISLSKVELFDKKGDIFWDNVEKWLINNPDKEGYLLPWKYDGLSITLYYKNGNFTNAVTKGKNGIGEDILRNVLKMKNVKTHIEGFTGALKAEIMITIPVFEKEIKQIKEKIYKNPRNAAAGIARKFKGKIYAKFCSLKYHGVFSDCNIKFSSEIEKFRWLKSLGFEVDMPVYINNIEQLKTVYFNRQKKRDKLKFEVDGLVLISNSESGGMPDFATALKFPAVRKESTVENIILQGGRTGRWNPVAKIEPVEIGGVTVRSATLCSVDEMNRLEIKIGDRIIVSRAGDTIPKIEESLTKHDDYKVEFPDNCPMCGQKLEIYGAFLVCFNEECDSRKIGNLKRWVEVLKEEFGFRSLGEKRIEEMYERKLVVNIADFYKLTPEILMKNLKNVKEKSAEKILVFKKYKEWTVSVFFGALSIPYISKKIFKLITDAGYNSIDAIMGISVEQLKEIKGIKKERAGVIVDWLEKKISTINEASKYINIIPEKEPSSNKLQGKTFCVTGTLTKDRDEFKVIIEDNGGKFRTSVSGKLDYLIVGEGGGGKRSKAEGLGVKVINENEFMEMIK